MAKHGGGVGGGGKGGGGKGGGGGGKGGGGSQPSAGWPSTTGEKSGGGRDNAAAVVRARRARAAEPEPTGGQHVEEGWRRCARRQGCDGQPQPADEPAGSGREVLESGVPLDEVTGEAADEEKPDGKKAEGS